LKAVEGVFHILACFVTGVSYCMTSWVHTAWGWSRVQYLSTTSCLSRNCWCNSLLPQRKEWIFDKPLSAILFIVGWSLSNFTFFVFQQCWHARWLEHHTLGTPLVPSIHLEKDLLVFEGSWSRMWSQIWCIQHQCQWHCIYCGCCDLWSLKSLIMKIVQWVLHNFVCMMWGS
jgi:hypothetical protein